MIAGKGSRYIDSDWNIFPEGAFAAWYLKESQKNIQ